MSKIRNWAQLLRVPNTFTACSDVLAGFSILGGFAYPYTNYPTAATLLSLGSISLYWAGMVLNDVFDVEEDRKNNRVGPLVDERIRWNHAAWFGGLWLLLGIVLSAISPLTIALQIPGLSRRMAPGIIAVLLAALILGYDKVFKQTSIAPLLMGFCRGLNLMLGMALAWAIFNPSVYDLTCALIATIGQIVFVTGITLAARKEFDMDQTSSNVPIGWLCSLLGGAIIACSPIANEDRPLRFESPYLFPLLIFLLLLPWGRHAIRSIQTRQGKDLGAAIRQAIISILFMDAALALEFSGNIPGIIICSLIIPTLFLSKWFRST